MLEIATRDQERLQLQMRQVKLHLFQYSPRSKLISAHTFAYISLDAMIPQEADKTHIEYAFPVVVECLKIKPFLGKHKFRRFLRIGWGGFFVYF